MPASKTVAHPITGAFCVFDDVTHTYYTDRSCLTSVTTMVKRCFPKFDADAAAERVAAREGKTKAAVLDGWARKGADASRLGTRVHEIAEDCVMGRQPRHAPESENERMMMGSAWSEVGRLRLQGWTFLAAEQILFVENVYLAGTVDLIARDPKGTMWILDWKTNAELLRMSKYGQMGLGVCSDIESANLEHYALQLGVYREMMRLGGYTAEPVEIAVIHVKPTCCEHWDLQFCRRDMVLAVILDHVLHPHDEDVPF